MSKKSALFLAIVGSFMAFTVALAAQQDKTTTATASKPAAGTQIKPKVIKIDRNHDGKVDRIETYNEKGEIVSVESDTNGDGKIDEWVTYENGIPVKGQKDINGDGKPDTTLFYDTKGTVIKSESDTNGDGIIDEWVYYEEGKPVKAEKDTNKDGKPDVWITY